MIPVRNIAPFAILLMVVTLSWGIPPLIVDVACNPDLDKSVIISVFGGKDKFVYISGCNSDEGEFGGAGLGLNFDSVAFSQCSLNWDQYYTAYVTENLNTVLATDTKSKFICNRKTDPFSVTAAFGVSDVTAGVLATGMIDPEPTIKFTDAASNKDGPEKTSATFDELMRVHISIDDIYTGHDNGFDIQLRRIEVTNTAGGSIVILTGADPGITNTFDGCVSKPFWEEVQDIQPGYLMVEFRAFLLAPYSGSFENLMFTCYIEKCPGQTCPNYDCSSNVYDPTPPIQAGRKKRDLANDSTIEEIQSSRRLRVYSFPVEDTDVTVDEQHAGFSEQCELCMGRLAVFGTMSVLIAALLFSLVGCVFLFVRYQQSLKTKYKDTS